MCAGSGGSWIGSFGVAWGGASATPNFTDTDAAAAVVSTIAFLCWDSSGQPPTDDDSEQQLEFEVTLPTDPNLPAIDISNQTTYIIDDDVYHRDGFTNLSLTYGPKRAVISCADMYAYSAIVPEEECSHMLSVQLLL